MVAFIIKLSTSLFGTNEFGVRIGSIVCWVFTAFFSTRLSNTIKKDSGIYAVLLLSILPFFFIHSLIITPDIPMILCWSATLFYLYRATVLEDSGAWYLAGLWIGLGMLSKYSIALLGPATLLYLLIMPYARRWFLRKEPYLCVLIATLLFTPVIYWNATHHWASFVFQSTRRLQALDSFSFHQLLGLFIVFLTPLGIWRFVSLFQKRHNMINHRSKRFIQIYTIVPLTVFSLFSLTHEIKFNWIGPCLLALIPWLAAWMHDKKANDCKYWCITALILLIFYILMISSVIFGRPEHANKTLLSKYISWRDLTEQVHAIGVNTELTLKTTPEIVPMDLYNISSELAFYQAKLLAKGNITKVYAVRGRDFFDLDSLMYRYWVQQPPVAGQVLILISEHLYDFNRPEVTQRVIAISPVKALWSHNQGYGLNIREYYYQVVRVKAS
jgi:dolichol-phosphate mannosyltransferase